MFIELTKSVDGSLFIINKDHIVMVEIFGENKTHIITTLDEHIGVNQSYEELVKLVGSNLGFVPRAHWK